VVSFAEWIASLLIPGGAILRLVQGIYKLVMWFVDNIQRILRWVNAVLDSLGNIAIGAVGAAIGFIVGAMKLIIPVILDFFAKLLNIGGIVDSVKNIINKIVGPIHKAIDKMVDWLKGILNKVVDKVKGIFGKKEDKGKQPVVEQKMQGGHDTELGKVVHFTADGEAHKLWIVAKGSGSIEIMVASDESPVERLLLKWASMSKATKKDKANIDEALKLYKELMISAKEAQQKMADAQKAKDEKKAVIADKADDVVETKEVKLASLMEELFKKFGKGDEIDAATIAEAHGKFQVITDRANSYVGSNLSSLVAEGLLSEKQIQAAKGKLNDKEGPWMYWVIYGTAVENRADELVQSSNDFKSLIGNNHPDFAGRDGGKYEGLVFDITTTNQATIDAHIGRTRDKQKAGNYKNVIITTYTRIGSQQHIIAEIDKNNK
jgi:hypothetical protein